MYKRQPLFIYGGAGLGKTHLLHAIGHYIKEHCPNLKVYYTVTERFMNEMVSAMMDRRMHRFKEKYRSKDVLLLDDIQFLAEKEMLQEEIFHTFNDLYHQGKQIVIASDRSPREIPTLKERLVSRFLAGLVADIQPPDFETRLAILRKKAVNDNIEIDDEVLVYIASKIKSNIRDLEGCLIKLLAMSSITGAEVNIEMAKEILREFFQEEDEQPLPQKIITKTAEMFDLRREDILGPRRTAEIVIARQTAMFLVRELTNLTLMEIAQLFKKKDHTTILHACEKIAEKINSDSNLRAKITALKSQLHSG